MKKLQLLALLLLINGGVFSQAYFKHYTAGEAYYKNREYKAAIESFTKVIEEKSEHDRALNLRGLSYENVGDYEKAAQDFKKATSIKEKMAEYHGNLGRVYFHLKEYDKAIITLAVAIDRDKKMLPAYSSKLHSHMALRQFAAAVETGKEAVSKQKSAETYYNLGIAQDSLMKFEDAIYSFSRAKFYSSKMIEAYIGMAYSNMKIGALPKAIAASDKSLEIDPKNIQALLLRLDIEKANNNPQNAIDVVSKIISYNPDVKKYYMMRGAMYQELGQSKNAITDFTKSISFKKDDYFVYYQRAKSYEVMSDYKLAIKDYETLRTLLPSDERAEKIFEEAKTRLYELNKESNDPEIVIIAPDKIDENTLTVLKGTLLYTIKGQIKDQSKIGFIKVNENDAIFNKDSLNPTFEIELNIQDNKELSITAFDVYQNSETKTYKIIETEVDAPVIKLISPTDSVEGIVYVFDDAPTLFIEGIIEDESLIKKIHVEGATASYVLDEMNPKFSVTIKIENKESFVILAEDEYGNKTERKFTIKRETTE